MTEQTQNAAQHEDNKLIAERRAKLAALREQGNPFPNDFRRDATAAELQAKYGDKSKEELEGLGIKVAIAGRMMLDRKAFKVVQDMTGRIQIYASKDVQKDTKHWDMGDIVGVRGTLSKSGKGDLYVTMDEYVLLTKSLRPLPEKHKGLTDTEARYRHRYVDLMVNEDSRRVFHARSKIINAMRQYFAERDFMEVETPMLQVIPGGATARPFVTHHNTLDMELYLRIALELHLKRLIVGGMERVYEIGRIFRNEGISTRHNPEFTMMELYQAFADWTDVMAITERLITTAAADATGSTVLEIAGQTVDLAEPWPRLSMTGAVSDAVGREVHPSQPVTDLAAIAAESGVSVAPNWGPGKIIEELFEHHCESSIVRPTFVTGHPVEISPLARVDRNDPYLTERFELFVDGRELANGYSELNDPVEQRARFEEEQAAKEAGDAERGTVDEDYLRALEYGMPPTGGLGIGMDRVAMLLSGVDSIREVILFPTLRPEVHDR